MDICPSTRNLQELGSPTAGTLNSHRYGRQLYVELLLFASAASAIVAAGSRIDKTSRFGLSFFALFSSLAIYGMGEVLSALFYLTTLGVTLTALVAFLEEKFKTISSGTGNSTAANLMFASLVAISFLVTYLVSQQVIYSISASIAIVGVMAIARRCLVKLAVGVAILEGAVFVILARIQLFTAPVSILLCLLMLTSSLGIPYALAHGKK